MVWAARLSSSGKEDKANRHTWSDRYTSNPLDALSIFHLWVCDRALKMHPFVSVPFNSNAWIVYIVDWPRKEREILHVLRRALFGHHVQHHNETENAVLHSQSHHSMYGHLLPDYFDLLPAQRFWWKGKKKTTFPQFYCYLSWYTWSAFLVEEIDPSWVAAKGEIKINRADANATKVVFVAKDLYDGPVQCPAQRQYCSLRDFQVSISSCLTQDPS